MSTFVDVPGGRIEVVLRGSDVPEERRDTLLDQINRVIATNWQSRRAAWWSREHSPFRDDHGLALFHADGEVIAYFILQTLHLDGAPVFYGAGTAVLAGRHGRRHYPLMQAHMMTAAWRATEPRPARVYVAWRTRNPAIWISNSRYCKALAPSLWDGREDPELQEACVRVAGLLYPGHPIDVPSMVMHNVFDDFAEVRRPRQAPEGSMGARLAAMLANPSDALFTLGIVDPSVFEDLARSVEPGKP